MTGTTSPEKSIDAIKEKISSIRFAILKIAGKSFMQAARCMVETIQLDDEGNIWCVTNKALPKIHLNNRGFNVSLRYVRKEDDTFMHVTGIAHIEQYSRPLVKNLWANKIFLDEKNYLLIRITMSEVQYFKKKKISKYTSFLQSVWSYSFGKLMPSNFNKKIA